MSVNEFDHCLKLLLVGKSSILLRYCEQRFNDQHIATIGVDFKIKTIQQFQKIIKLQIWDTAGQERFRTITNSYYRGAVGVMLVFDTSDNLSFDALDRWVEDISHYADENVAVILVGTKIDLLDSRQITRDEALEFASSIGAPYYEVSAKEDINVDDVFFEMVNIVFHGWSGAPSSNISRFQQRAKNYSFGLCEKITGEKMFLKSIHHHLFVTDVHFTLTTVQNYQNKTANSVEIVYRFASVYNDPCEFYCEMWDAKVKKRTVMRGKALEKIKGREKYDNIIAGGNTAALLEKEAKAVHCLHLGNVAPGTNIKVVIKIVQKTNIEINDIERSEINARVIIPALQSVKGDGSRNVERGYDVEKIMKVSGEILFVNTPKTNIKSVTASCKISKKLLKQGKSRNHFSFTTGKISNAADFELNISLQNYPKCVFLVQRLSTLFSENLSASASIVFPSDKSKSKKMKKVKYKYVGCFKFSPFDLDVPTLPTEKLALNIIVDCSGSMQNERIENTKTALQLFVQSLDTDATEFLINIIRFGTKFEKMCKAPQALTEKTFVRTMKYINDTKASLGGTNIYAPIFDILKRDGFANIPSSFEKVVILLTDGEDENYKKTVNLVLSRASESRFFCFTIGKDVNPVLCDTLSGISNGRSCSILEACNIRKKVLLQLSHIVYQKRLEKFEFRLPTKTDVTNTNSKKTNKPGGGNNQFDDRFSMKSNYKFFFMENVVQMMYVGYSTGENHDYQERVNSLALESGSGLDILTVQDRIDKLEKNVLPHEKRKKKNEKMILEYSLAFNVLSSMTSYALELENKEKVFSELVLENVSTAKYASNKRRGGMLKAGAYKLDSSLPEIETISLLDTGSRNRNNLADTCTKIGNNITSFFQNLFTREPEIVETTYDPHIDQNKHDHRSPKGKRNIDGDSHYRQEIIQIEERVESTDESTDVDGNGDLDVVGDMNEDYEDEFTTLLLLQTMKGMWKMSTRLCKLLKMAPETIEQSNPLNSKEVNFWATAIVVVFVKTTFSEKREEWVFIVNKSEKLLKKNNYDWIIDKAKRVV